MISDKEIIIYLNTKYDWKNTNGIKKQEEARKAIEWALNLIKDRSCLNCLKNKICWDDGMVCGNLFNDMKCNEWEKE